MESHLLQMRGLKPHPDTGRQRANYVASFTDAWIETKDRHIQKDRFCRIFYRCVD